ncbi:hypothetical protein VTL71DRAFT_3474 [Oculimacula yallundae]|uniref:Uncharacterized protein n=1 Tax=Oculimacula yallundae TaxID=86028 RepID=A0ABR4C7D5_9HELO
MKMDIPLYRISRPSLASPCIKAPEWRLRQEESPRKKEKKRKITQTTQYASLKPNPEPQPICLFAAVPYSETPYAKLLCYIVGGKMTKEIVCCLAGCVCASNSSSKDKKSARK